MAAVAYGPQNAVPSQLKPQSRLLLSADDKLGRSVVLISVYVSYCGCFNCRK